MFRWSPAGAPPEQVRILIVSVPEGRWRISGGGGSCWHPSGMRGDGNDFNSGGAPFGDHRLMAVIPIGIECGHRATVNH